MGLNPSPRLYKATTALALLERSRACKTPLPAWLHGGQSANFATSMCWCCHAGYGRWVQAAWMVLRPHQMPRTMRDYIGMVQGLPELAVIHL